MPDEERRAPLSAHPLREVVVTHSSTSEPESTPVAAGTGLPRQPSAARPPPAEKLSSGPEHPHGLPHTQLKRYQTVRGPAAEEALITWPGLALIEAEREEAKRKLQAQRESKRLLRPFSLQKQGSLQKSAHQSNNEAEPGPKGSTDQAKSSLAEGVKQRSLSDGPGAGGSVRLSENGDTDDFEVDELMKVADDVANKKRRHSKHILLRGSFWYRFMPGLVTVLMLAGGTLAVVFADNTSVVYHFQLWRWLFFFACMAPIWKVSELWISTLVWGIEKQFFTKRKVLYYVIATRKPLANMLKALLILPVFVGFFSEPSQVDRTVHDVYDNILKFLGCLCLFTAANVAKTLAAKQLSAHFHKETHFLKMQEALNKEYYLQVLSQPRPSETSLGTFGMFQGFFGGENKSPIPALDADVSRQPLEPMAAADREDTDCLLKVGEKMHQAAGESARSKLALSSGEPNGMPDDTHLGSTASEESAPSQYVPHADAVEGADANLGRSKWSKARVLFKVAHHIQATAAASHRPSQDPEEEEEDLKEGVSSGLTIKHSSKLNEGEIIQRLSQVEKHIRKKQLKVAFTDQLGKAKHVEQANIDKEARQLASYLFWNLKRDFDRTYVVEDDLQDLLPESQAKEAFDMLDADGDGKATLSNMRDAVIKVYSERLNLALQLKDTKTVVGKLETVIGTVLHIFFIFIYLMIFDVNVTKVWLTFSSVVLAFAFIFGNSIRTIYEAVIFLFIIHPFDVGDALIVDNDYHKVEEIALSVTVLVRWDGARLWYPNTRLGSMPLLNLSRSDKKWESFKVLLDMNTPPSALDELAQVLSVFFEENSAEFTGRKSVTFRESHSPLKITLAVYYEYNHNGVDTARVGKWRSAMFVVIMECLTRLDINFTAPAMAGLSDNLSQLAQSLPSGYHGQPTAPPQRA